MSNQIQVYQTSNTSWGNISVGTNGTVLSVNTSNPPSNLSWISPSTGTVTSITPGTGLTASPNPIIGTGSISITNTAVTAATYSTSASATTGNTLLLTVNAQGQLTAASTTLSTRWGTATLSSSTVTIADTNIASTSVVTATYNSTSSFSSLTAGSLAVSLNAGVGFTITSTHLLDNNSVFYGVNY